VGTGASDSWVAAEGTTLSRILLPGPKHNWHAMMCIAVNLIVEVKVAHVHGSSAIACLAASYVFCQWLSATMLAVLVCSIWELAYVQHFCVLGHCAVMASAAHRYVGSTVVQYQYKP
jgi:hypothetical protein